ncbi:dihydrodipicolinate synthase family protein [Natrinema altunense]|uniref:Dihydrodipicolinate synthase/n-acetylneuraminate lyase n=1 Tax=Natrinema altunense (strain JCM 12890 / CGMCC 1.3731 / AJ2) TaxID=1227494 RepID=L9ZAQ1_NATA2|nr:dihydrodipicolinate synthase family protein [Natrinema altunense]ELY83479.1 dihydrodipicolinate synthase/n-acetylneuraminate lyase [Natrinema altunense JCM 12890]
MHGTGVPLVTPFDSAGRVDRARLRSFVDWLEDGGVDFLVPCGSSGEAPLLTTDERIEVVETVAETTTLPVLAGTGQEGYEPTLETTERAAAAGADAALVVTPSYYASDDAALAAYYRALADDAPIPIYLYSVPKFTGHALSPRTVASLATHENIAGIKDSSGSLESIQRLDHHTADESFAVFVGSGSIYAAGLAAGADGGVLGMANVVPRRASGIYRLANEGDGDAARARNAALVELNRAVTAEYGVPGLKSALSLRERPMGEPRRPLQSLGEPARRELASVLTAALDATPTDRDRRN